MPDIATSVRATNGTVSRLVQDGSGGLNAPVASSVAAKPDPIAIADVDGDGMNDIVVLHDFVSSGIFSPPTNAGWIRQTSPGVFGGEETFPVDDFSTTFDAKALAVGDIDGDGANDILVATDFGMSLLLQNSGLLPSLGGTWLVDAQPSSIATNVAASVNPSITLGRDVTNVDDTTVQLRDADGNPVAETVLYNAPGRLLTIEPSSPLPNGRYAVHLSGLTDTGGETLADASTTFLVGPAPDEVAPQTTLHSPPSGFRSTATVTLSFSSSKAGSVFWCSDNNQPYHTCASPQHVTAKVGAHSFRVFARDAAGNEDATPALATWTYRPAVHGYWMLGGAGAIYHFGNAPGLGNAATTRAVDVDVSPSGYGYWIVDGAGRVFAFGDARATETRPRSPRATPSRASVAPRVGTATGCSPSADACTRSAMPTSTATCAPSG